jgi:hypothetical protein
LTVNQNIENLNAMIASGREDDIYKEYQKLLETMKTQPQYATLDEKQLAATAKTVYQNATGTSLTDAIEQNCSGSFATGFKKAFNIFGDDSVSKDELLEKINATPKSRGAEAKEVTGKVVGVASTAAAGAGIGFAISLGNPVGAGIGAAVGGAIGFFKSIF